MWPTPATSRVHLFLQRLLAFLSWFHRSCVSPRLPVPRYIQQLSPDSFHSSSVTQRPVVLISPLFLESILRDSFFSVFRRHASPFLSLPVLSCPSLFEKQVLEHTLSCPLKTPPVIVPFCYPRTLSPDSRFPQRQLMASAERLWAVVTRATVRPA